MAIREQLKWHDEKADNSPWINALAELRQRATREGHCFQHVQAITVAIDQYKQRLSDEWIKTVPKTDYAAIALAGKLARQR
jgi:hypothetical protein